MQITCATSQIEAWINRYFPLLAQITPQDHTLLHTFMLTNMHFLNVSDKALNVFSKLKIKFFQYATKFLGIC